MWELDHKESWALEELMLLNCGVGEDSWESLGHLGDQTSSKGNKSWIFIGRTDAEAETPILWPPNVKNWFTEKDPDAGKDWGQEEKGATEDEMVGWHHWLNGHEFKQILGDSEGQGSLACCSPIGSQRVGHDWATEGIVQGDLVTFMNKSLCLQGRVKKYSLNSNSDLNLVAPVD